MRAGVQLLEELGALVSTSSTDGGRSTGGGRSTPRLTGLGRKLARLPIDPRLARMILEADRLGCLREVLVITAALSIQDPRERPVEHRTRADQLHARFRDPRSDFVAWLNLWRHLRAKQKEMGSSAFRRMCREEHLNYLRVREWQDFESQLRQVAKQVGLKPGAPVEDDAGRRPVSTRRCSPGCSRTSGCGTGTGATTSAPEAPASPIFPGSGLFKRQPDFVMAAELVETSRLWGRQNAAIDPLWAERLAGDLVKRTWSEPHWSKKRASALAHERVTLYGVPLVADRARTPRHGTSPRWPASCSSGTPWCRGSGGPGTGSSTPTGGSSTRPPSSSTVPGATTSSSTRRPCSTSTTPGSPADVVSGAHFDTWWKQERRTPPGPARPSTRRCWSTRAAGLDEGDFPDEWHEGPLTLPLRYHFEPGHAADGVTIDVPLATLNTVGAAPFTWNVPGLRHELVTALIRSLPKPLRVNFVPAPDVARRFLEAVPPGEEPLSSVPVALPAVPHRRARAARRRGT